MWAEYKKAFVIASSVGFTWQKRTWRRTHVDSKSSVDGELTTWTMVGADEQLRIKLQYGSEALVHTLVPLILHDASYNEWSREMRQLSQKRRRSQNEQRRFATLREMLKTEEKRVERLQTQAAIDSIATAVEVNQPNPHRRANLTRYGLRNLTS